VPHFDASSAECLVLTYKEGLLSAVAHDLEIRVTGFEVDVDADPLAVRATFDAASLRVVGAIHNGAVQPGTLGDGDKQKIEHNIVADVLHAAEHPVIRFASTAITKEGDGYRVTGTLTLHGRARPVSFEARPKGERMVAELQLHQPDFGIKPYSAMLGALKIKSDVTVRCAVPRAGLGMTAGE
jgi:polyisoprenoid-binding protein YceI